MKGSPDRAVRGRSSPNAMMACSPMNVPFRRSGLGALAAAAVLALAASSAQAQPAGSTKDAYRHYLKALLLQQQGQHAAALAEYEAAARLDP
ncbi:MAG: hypothetical protein L0177_20690, partial [Chloroflexi bacterium]|nr:hypothetical protein [Chloroflexota bacterium]